MPRGTHPPVKRLWCGHEEYADGSCAEMCCPNYYMKTGFMLEGREGKEQP